tara:strand:- start:6355 stop:6543 length:189 start_codon:yes stop_codon:yes gene_type:complete
MVVRPALTTPPMPLDVKVNVFGEQATLDAIKVRLLLQSLCDYRWSLPHVLGVMGKLCRIDNR